MYLLRILEDTREKHRVKSLNTLLTETCKKKIGIVTITSDNMKNNQKERCEYKLVRKMKLLNHTSILNILTNQKTIHAKKKKKKLECNRTTPTIISPNQKLIQYHNTN